MLNEELETINAQLAEKVEELDRAHDDLVNLLDATLFLDSELKIKRFTPGLTEVIALQPGDEGRFLATSRSSSRIPTCWPRCAA